MPWISSTGFLVSYIFLIVCSCRDGKGVGGEGWWEVSVLRQGTRSSVIWWEDLLLSDKNSCTLLSFWWCSFNNSEGQDSSRLLNCWSYKVKQHRVVFILEKASICCLKLSLTKPASPHHWLIRVHMHGQQLRTCSFMTFKLKYILPKKYCDIVNFIYGSLSSWPYIRSCQALPTFTINVKCWMR